MQKTLANYPGQELRLNLQSSTFRTTFQFLYSWKALMAKKRDSLRGIRTEMQQRSIYRFWLLVTRVQRCQASFYVARFGRPTNGWKIMTVVGDHEGLTLTEVGKRTDLELDKITRTVDRMVEQGLIERRSDRTDSRLVRLRFTSKGRQAYKELNELRRALEIEFLSALKPAERETLYHFLDKLEQRSKSMFEGKHAWRRFVPTSRQTRSRSIGLSRQ